MSETEESLSDVMSGVSPFARSEGAKPDVKAAEPAEAAPSAAKEKPVEAAKPAEKATPPRDDTGKFTKAEEKPAEKPRADVAAIIDERRKRQEAERRLAEVLQQKPEAAKKPSVFEDEDKAITSRVDEGTRSLREMLYKQSVKLARVTYKDAYSEAEQAFMEAADKDDRLIEALRASDDPGEYIYTVGLQIKELADVGGDFVKYREKVTAGARTELDALKTQFDVLKAENEALKKAQAELDAVPRSLNRQSSGPAPKPGEDDPEDIKSIVRFGNKSR